LSIRHCFFFWFKSKIFIGNHDTSISPLFIGIFSFQGAWRHGRQAKPEAAQTGAVNSITLGWML
jgi:hypothetical protein